MKKHIISFLTVIYILNYIGALAPVILSAKENNENQSNLNEKIAEAIIKNDDARYAINLDKVKIHHLEYMLKDLELIVKAINKQLPFNSNNATADTMLVGTISISALISTLIMAGLTWLVGKILELGAYTACAFYGLNMYRLWARTNNFGAWLFWNFCSLNGWF